MSELTQIDDELHRAYDGDCWHGPSLKAVLEGVTAKLAAAKHPAITHSIWEMVLHMTVWIEVVRIRIIDQRVLMEPTQGDFPPVTDTSEQAWHTAIADLDREMRSLRRLVLDMDPEWLNEIVPGKDYPVQVMLHGTAQHFAYHAGQIVLLKKLVAER